MQRKSKLEEEKSVSNLSYDKYDKNSDDEGGSDDEDSVEEAIKQEDLIFRPESNLRQWLKKRGKEHCIDFDDEELKQLRTYFNSLDEDGSGSIGVDELEDPLIALGLVENRQQVQEIVDLVDEDGSQQIEFGEFLSIIKGGSNAAKEGATTQQKQSQDSSGGGTGAIYQFFKKLTSGQLKVEENPYIPFSLFISSYRRRKILDAMMNPNKGKREEGDKILNNYKKQIAEKMAREKAERGEIMSSGTHGGAARKRTFNKSSFRDDDDDHGMSGFANRMGDLNVNEPPEPEVLLSILHRRSKK